MKRDWTTEGLVEHWTLLPNELDPVGNKAGASRLGFALLLKFFQLQARFPSGKNEIPRAMVPYVAKQIGVDSDEYLRYDWRSRAISYHRMQIREFLGLREATLQDAETMTQGLCEEVPSQEQDIEHLHEIVYARFRALCLEPPTPDRLSRLIRSALRTYEERLFANIVEYRRQPRVLARTTS